MQGVENLRRNMTKAIKWPVCPAKTWSSLGIHPVWSIFSVRLIRFMSLATHTAHSEDTDQTGQMPRLIWVFTGHMSFCKFFCAHLLSIFFANILQASNENNLAFFWGVIWNAFKLICRQFGEFLIMFLSNKISKRKLQRFAFFSCLDSQSKFFHIL